MIKGEVQVTKLDTSFTSEATSELQLTFQDIVVVPWKESEMQPFGHVTLNECMRDKYARFLCFKSSCLANML